MLVPGILLNIQYVCLTDEQMWLLLIRVSSKSVFFYSFVISFVIRLLPVLGKGGTDGVREGSWLREL